jgi:hypothetical protein
MTASGLRECTCIVTGAGSGIGRAIAAALESAGATVYEADPAGAVDADGLANDLLEREEGVDLLVHSSGVGAADLLTAALLPGLRAKKGKVVLVHSTLALTATTALTALGNRLRRAAGKHGVRVVSVYTPERLRQPEDVASVVLDALAPDAEPFEAAGLLATSGPPMNPT